jgi:hypothetical protein
MRVGITGHQDLGNVGTITWLKNELEDTISQLKIEYGYSCLAIGADQLFAGILLKHNIPLIAVIPSENYEQTFDDELRDQYKRFLNCASEHIQLSHKQPSQIAFFDASKLLVNNCNVMIAIWNGLPAKGLGGTADVVRYATETHKKVIHLNPVTKTIKHF